MTIDDSVYMNRALNLARKAWGNTWPNPMVGAVIVKNGHILGEGYHHYAGSYHAEIEALRKCKENPQDSTMYVTLEPCCHFGKTPPCTEAIIQAGIKKVFISIKDPNPKVSGKGIKRLKAAGIEIHSGLLKEEATILNEGFIHFHRTGNPLVVLKIAQTLDGKIATANYDSKWITGKESRKFVQMLRAGSDAILVGSHTIIQDNPELVVHSNKPYKRYPYRIILDTRGMLNPQFKVFSKQLKDCPVFWVIGSQVSRKKIIQMENNSVKILQMKNKSSHIDLSWLMNELSKLDIHTLLVEGGSRIFGAFIDNCFADKMVIFQAPSIMGGQKSLSSIGGKGALTIDKLVHLKKPHYSLSGKDMVIEGYL